MNQNKQKASTQKGPVPGSRNKNNRPTYNKGHHDTKDYNNPARPGVAGEHSQTGVSNRRKAAEKEKQMNARSNKK